MAVEKMTISMPHPLVVRMQEECEQRGLKRSQFLQELVEHFFEEQEKRKKVEAYIESYRKHPETEEDLELSEAFLELGRKEGLYDDETW